MAGGSWARQFGVGSSRQSSKLSLLILAVSGQPVLWMVHPSLAKSTVSLQEQAGAYNESAAVSPGPSTPCLPNCFFPPSPQWLAVICCHHHASFTSPSPHWMKGDPFRPRRRRWNAACIVVLEGKLPSLPWPSRTLAGWILACHWRSWNLSCRAWSSCKLLSKDRKSRRGGERWKGQGKLCQDFESSGSAWHWKLMLLPSRQDGSVTELVGRKKLEGEGKA